jgi:hypothetical protein
MKIEIKGIVHRILDLQTFASGFQKRVLVIEEPHDKYPQFIPVEFAKDNVTKLDSLKRGQTVTIQADLGGNEYKEKFYCNVRGWKIVVDSAALASVETSAPDVAGDDEPPF